MKLYYHEATGILGVQLGAQTNIARAQVKRYSTLEIELIRVKADGTVGEFAPGAAGLLVVKTTGEYTGSAKLMDAEWTAPTQAGGGYVFELLVAGAALDGEIGTSAKVTLSMEMVWTNEGKRTVSPTVALEVANNYWREDDPEPEAPETPFPLAGEILIKGAQALTLAEQDQVRTNIGLEPGVDVIAFSEKGSAGGVATLDSGGKVPVAQLPDSVVGQIEYQGGWDAATDSPEIPAAASGNKGHYYVVTTGGSSDPDAAGRDFGVGDWIVSNGTTWDKVDNTEPVATTALAGISRRATEAEAIGGTEPAAHLTPETLAAVDRSYRSRINLLLCGF